MKKMIRGIAATALLAVVMPAEAFPLVDTGNPKPGLNDFPLVVDANDWLAGQVHLAAASQIHSVAGYLEGGHPGDTFTVSLYNDRSGNRPGALAYTSAATFIGAGWNGTFGLNGVVKAGDYWVALEVQEADTFVGVAPVGVPFPLARTAFDDGARYRATTVPLGFGLQVDAAALSEPGSYGLLATGLGLMGLRGVRRKTT